MNSNASHADLAQHHRVQAQIHLNKMQDVLRDATSHDIRAGELHRTGRADDRVKALAHHTEAKELRRLAAAHKDISSAHATLAEVHACQLEPPSGAAGSSAPLVQSGGV